MRIKLARWTEDDLWVIRRFNSPEMRLHLGGPEPDEKVVARHRKFVDWAEPGGAYRIDSVTEAVPVGGVVYWEREWAGERCYEAGWSVLPEYQGHGIASAAIGEVLALARAEGRLRYLYAFPSVDNPASNAVCRKAGFELTGESDFEYPPGHAMRSNVWRCDLSRPPPD